MNDPLNEMKNKLAEWMLPTEEFNKEFETHVGLVTKSVEEGDIKEYAPRVILVCGGDEGPQERKVVLVVLGDGMPRTNAEKQAVFAKLGLAAAANDLKVLMAIFQSEAWTLKLDKDEVKDVKNLPTPSEHPERVEVIVNVARSIDDREALATIPITGRKEDGTLILGEPDVQGFDEDDKKQVQDSLLSAFFMSFMTATLTKWAAKRAEEKDEELSPEVKLMLELLDSCPIKFKSAEEMAKELEEGAKERDSKLDDDFLRRFKR